MKNERAAGFGFGNKCGLAKEYIFVRCRAGESPSPQRYNINSLFEDDKARKRGVVFGESREVLVIANTEPEGVWDPQRIQHSWTGPIRKIFYAFEDILLNETEGQPALPYGNSWARSMY